MKERITDYKGRLACLYDSETGHIESSYKGYRTSTNLEIGAEFSIQRDDAVTIVTRISKSTFNTIKIKIS